ncbi:MAG: NAD+ synthase [Melioribacteraceae bacterium]|nr:NAD+ synthase [Melioribacteraceae bacterium]MCF8265765.1 NAD+ synthase [Melioribacteraceae bacterium]
MKIALCQINPIIGDIEGNKKKILNGYKKAQIDKVDIAIFPELSICGYPPQDLIEKREFREAVNLAALELSHQTNNVALLFGSITEKEERVGTGIYNSALLAYEGKIQFIQNKTLLPNYDVFDEVRYFESAEKVFIHEFKGEKLGISICEDIWNDDDYWKRRRYSRDPIKSLIDQGTTLLLNISASPYAYGRRKERHDMLSYLTKTERIALAYVCCTGAQTDLIFDGSSMCFDSSGTMVKVGKNYATDYLVFDTTNENPEVDHYEAAFEEEVLNALIFGLKEYATKSGFKKVLVGLSGGIDSALVTYIAAQSFGAENVHTVLMPSQFSSEGSIKDSEQLCENLGIHYDIIPIQPVFEKTLQVLQPAFGNLPENVAEENLQSRIRGLYLMGLSNKHGYLLCTTGNKSEMAVGYATLYGDMCGALAVIADVYKTDVYRISKFINREEEIIPSAIIEKAPSAELKPNQKDEDSLPPYETLDRILKMYLEEYKEIDEISEEINDYELVKSVLRLVDINEFKRKQAAPSLRVTTKAFGYGRRFPIVQGWRK